MAPFRRLLVAMALVMPASLSAQTSQPTEAITIEELVNRLQPVLQKTGQGARLYFDGICPVDGLLETMDFPLISVRPISRDATGIRAVRQMFPADTRIEQRGSVIVISLTSVPDTLLQVRLSPMTLTRVEQFQSELAVMAIDANLGVQTGLRVTGFHPPLTDMSILIGTWQDDRKPHLPTTLSNLTFDQALDDVAHTFGSIILFGVCKPQRLYFTTSRGGYDWGPPHSEGASRHE